MEKIYRHQRKARMHRTKRTVDRQKGNNSLQASVVHFDVSVVLHGVVGPGALAFLKVSGEDEDFVPVAQVLSQTSCTR